MKNKTKVNHKKLSWLIIVFILFISSLGANAQKITLRVGDQAPPIKAEKWLKGKPMPELEKGKVHVVEFGAVW